MIGWIISQIPLWVWVTVGLLVLAVVCYFASFFAPLWFALPQPVRRVLTLIGALIAAAVAGMTYGTRKTKEEQKRREAAANEHREELHRDVEKRSDTTIDRDFDKWVR